jgi:hypothetical protein
MRVDEMLGFALLYPTYELRCSGLTKERNAGRF